MAGSATVPQLTSRNFANGKLKCETKADSPRCTCLHCAALLNKSVILREFYTKKSRPVISFEVFPPKTDAAMQNLEQVLPEIVLVAAASGATHLVLGRPIIASSDPGRAFEEMRRQIER